MVNVHLLSSSRVWILAISVPLDDIQRLSVRPLKWLRFVTFTICGVTGKLATTKDGPSIVDYDSISFDDLTDDYYYIPDGDASWSLLLLPIS